MKEFIPKTRLRLVAFIAAFFALALFLIAVLLSLHIDISTSAYRYSDTQAIPKQSVGLLLGTSKYLETGERNIFFVSRIQAVKDLYDAKKIDCVLISGDNRSVTYNEPIDMQESLLELGVPSERMYLDYAGVRTLDSVIRAKEVFGLDSFTIISQPFHNARALYLARHNGESPIAYNAASISFRDAPFVYVRELGSRIVAVYDAYFETDPKFGGKKIEIEFDPTIRPVPAKICTPRT